MLWVIAGMSCILAIDLPPVLRQRRWRELISFFAVWAAALAAGLVQAANLPIPSVGALIIAGVRYVLHFFTG